MLRGHHVKAGNAVHAGARADNLKRGANGIGVMLIDAGNKAVGIAHVDHHGAEVIGVEHPLVGFRAGDAIAMTQAEEFIDVG